MTEPGSTLVSFQWTDSTSAGSLEKFYAVEQFIFDWKISENLTEYPGNALTDAPQTSYFQNFVVDAQINNAPINDLRAV